MIIDSHQHFWQYDPLRHSWIADDMATIRKNFMPSDIKMVYSDNAIDGCVAVQVDQTLEETDFLLKLSNENDFIKGVVGWVDLRDAAIEMQLEAYIDKKKLKGFRHIVQGEADPNFLLRPNFLTGISLLEKFNYTYDILVYPYQLGAVLEFVKQFPNQKFVINHIGKPYIKDGFYDGWAVLMKEIAKYENVVCKFSGMITEADYKFWTPNQIHPYMDLILNTFGAKRILFGSNWPVCLVAGSYSKVKSLSINFISKLSVDEQRQIMGANAIRFYNL
tara:strand:+ start:96600 stop:97427 length:828 start_codon:yes stop_codon:yes gene_type:complete